jgi:signal transduction histidine kinase/CheY-like chemotaxis protein
MTAMECGPNINLEELHSQLVGRLALLVAGGFSLLVWLTRPQEPFPVATSGLLVVMLSLGIGVRVTVGAHSTLARHLLVWGLTVGLLISMTLFSTPWLPFLGLMLAFIGEMLVGRAGFGITALIATLATYLAHSGIRAYPLVGLLITLAFNAVMSRLVVRTLYTGLEWAWTMQQRADHLLELARDRQGELNRALKSLDISNVMLRRTQRELITARKQADTARLMKEQFAANVSHELRTPLNIILGFSEVMCLSSEVYGDMDWPSTLRQDIYQIYTSSSHLLDLIDDVLDLSRFEMVGFALKKEPTPLESLLRDAVGIVANLVRSRSIHLEVEIAPDLPTLEIDRTRVRQALLNLLNNAVRFTDEGTVRLEAQRGEGEVVITVSDTGPGIPADQIPLLFQEFYQVDRSLHRKHEGTGLGLAISKHFVEAHDGCIWVESEEGVGSTFTFTLPIPGEHTPFSRLRVDRPLEPSAPETPPPVLVVDPDPTVVALVDRHLEGYEVIQVKEVDRLAEEVALHHPQTVICNVLPGERCEYQNLLSASVPLIECSLPSQAWLADDLSVTACLNKPVTTERLLQEVESLDGIGDILVVDDDRGFCRLVERMLKASDGTFSVRKAYDGEESLRALRARRPDLLLLDLVMPGVDGFQVLEEMRREPELADVPVVLLTATSYAEDVLAQRRGQVVINRPDGLSPAEALRCLQATIDVLEPHYDERAVPEHALA